jgi:hypothetical protein
MTTLPVMVARSAYQFSPAVEDHVGLVVVVMMVAEDHHHCNPVLGFWPSFLPHYPTKEVKKRNIRAKRQDARRLLSDADAYRQAKCHATWRGCCCQKEARGSDQNQLSHANIGEYMEHISTPGHVDAISYLACRRWRLDQAKCLFDCTVL